MPPKSHGKDEGTQDEYCVCRESCVPGEEFPQGGTSTFTSGSKAPLCLEEVFTSSLIAVDNKHNCEKWLRKRWSGSAFLA